MEYKKLKIVAKTKNLLKTVGFYVNPKDLFSKESIEFLANLIKKME